MKTFIYLIIILDFTQTALCKQFCNDTVEDLLHKSPNVRRKREYTRWRAQTEKPTEFVVKVFDDYDDVIPPPTKVVALVPVAPRRTPPKIIVSGITVRVPPRSEATAVDWAVEYTRFKPPAPNPPKAILTIGAEGKNVLPIGEKPMKIEPKIKLGTSILLQDYGVMKPPKRVDIGLHPQRDESPPAGPHFIPLTSAPAVPRIDAPRNLNVPFESPPIKPPQPVQYAPVVPVAIAKQNIPTLYLSATSKVQSVTNRYVIFSKYSKSTIPTDALKNDETTPTRTTLLPSEELYDQRQLDLDEITSNDIVITRRPQKDNERLVRTSKSDLKSLLGNVVGRLLSRTIASSAKKVVPTNAVTESTSKKRTSEIYINVYQDYEARRTLAYDFSMEKTIPSTTSTVFEVSETQTSTATSTTEEPQFMPMESLQTVEEIAVTHAGKETEQSRIGDFEYYEEKEVSINAATLRATNDENTGNITHPEISRRAQNRVCNLEDANPFNFTSVATLNEVYEKLKLWAARSPVTNIVDITQGNLTTMENPIYMLAVDDPSGGQLASAKQTVLIVAGIQGRDHYAVASAMYVLYQLIERSEIHSDLLNKYRFWIIPVFNPDGYEYSRSFTNRREWKKNLRQNWETCKDSGSLSETCKPCEEYGIRCYLKPCHGVNLDRNFEYQWIPGQELRAEHPCGDLYAGKRQLSEIETFSLTNYLNELRNQPIFAFIAFKEGDVLGVLYPYSHTKKRRPFDMTYRNRAVAAASSAFSINGRPYVAGQTSEFLRECVREYETVVKLAYSTRRRLLCKLAHIGALTLYAGGIEDWLDGHMGIDNSYAIIMNRPGDTKYTVTMDRVAHEAYAAMDTLLLQKSIVDASPKPHRGQFAAARRRSGNAATSRINLRVLFVILFISWFS